MTIPKHIYHYYELDNGPFRNISEFGPEKAMAIQETITAGFNSQRPPQYIELRFALEKRLKEHFIAKEGNPSRDDPFYFSLGPCDWLETWYANPGIIKIPLADFKPEHLSFTYPDSMISFQLHDDATQFELYRKSCNGQIFLLEELEDLIQEYGLPTEEKWKSEKSMHYDRYIEVQVWDDSIVGKYKELSE